MEHFPEDPIGIYDSGIGGLSVLRAVRKELPGESLLYFADQKHLPYGERPLPAVRAMAEGVARYLIERGVKMVVVACNTASGAALHELRAWFPKIPFVGMEPAVKPAAERTQTKRIGVLATPTTFDGPSYASVVERFAEGVTVIERPCPGLVAIIESGDEAALEPALIEWIEPLTAEGIDQLVLGCTHYPLVRERIQRIAGPGVTIIDPAPAVARQVRRVLTERGMLAHRGHGALQLQTTGEPHLFGCQVERYLELNGVPIHQARWRGADQPFSLEDPDE